MGVICRGSRRFQDVAPIPQIKVVGNDGSQGGRTVRVPTCDLLRGVSEDPFFILRSQWRRPVDLSMPTFQGPKVKSLCRFQSPTIMFLDPFAEGCFTVVLCGFWVAPIFQARASCYYGLALNL